MSHNSRIGTEHLSVLFPSLSPSSKGAARTRKNRAKGQEEADFDDGENDGGGGGGGGGVGGQRQLCDAREERKALLDDSPDNDDDGD